MFEENDTPTAKPTDLESLSVDDLRQRIDLLKAQIIACETELAKKQTHKSAADALFGGDS